jgi:hypothetical protein
LIVVLVPSRGSPGSRRGHGRLGAGHGRSAGRRPRPPAGRRRRSDPGGVRESLEAADLPAGEVLLVAEPRVGYTGALNRAAARLWDDVDVLGAFGDDVVFRTHGWDERVRAALATPGHRLRRRPDPRPNHPSAVFMSSAIAKALGWLALPATTHQWADDGWKRLGQATGCLRFLEGVVVEHEHPAVGKAEWDETYASVFTDERAKSDYEGFIAWVESGGLEADAAKVRSVL